jgi:hypothetical protein
MDENAKQFQNLVSDCRKRATEIKRLDRWQMYKNIAQNCVCVCVCVDSTEHMTLPGALYLYEPDSHLARQVMLHFSWNTPFVHICPTPHPTLSQINPICIPEPLKTVLIPPEQSVSFTLLNETV